MFTEEKQSWNIKRRESTGFAALHSDAIWDTDRDLTLQLIGLVFFKDWDFLSLSLSLSWWDAIFQCSWILCESAKIMAALISHCHYSDVYLLSVFYLVPDYNLLVLMGRQEKQRKLTLIISHKSIWLSKHKQFCAGKASWKKIKLPDFLILPKPLQQLGI